MKTYDEAINNLKDWYELFLKWEKKINEGKVMPWDYLDFVKETANFYHDAFHSKASMTAFIYEKKKETVIRDVKKLVK